MELPTGHKKKVGMVSHLNHTLKENMLSMSHSELPAQQVTTNLTNNNG